MDYGGRGISVCERWLKFENFLADMGPRPDGHTLDRIDSNGNYEPTNCRWATAREQAANRRNLQLVTFNGVSLTITDWSRKTGIPLAALFARFAKGWSPERCLTQLPKKLPPIEFAGESLSIQEWATRVGINVATLHYRLRIGWSVEKTMTTPRIYEPSEDNILTLDGKTMSVAEWSALKGLKAGTVRARLKRGWPVERALSIVS